jgi:hypothetical protein
MKASAACVGVMLLVSVSVAWAQDPERLAMARVRLSTEAAIAKDCPHVGRVSDDSVKDLRRKILRAGGNTGVLSFGGIDDMSTIYADVFRCGAKAAAPLPPNVPLPPPGPPPPGPPGVSR